MDPTIEAELRAQIEQLRTEMDDLRRQVADARGRVQMTMRAQSRCPGCGATELFHSTHVMAVHSHPDAGLCLHRPTKMFGRIPPQGVLELYGCRRCGLAEWYVTGVGELDFEPDHLRIIDGAPDDDAGPYR